MDCIERIIKKSNVFFKKLSFKKVLAIYILIAVAGIISLYGVTILLCNGWIKLIYTKYNYQDYYFSDLLYNTNIIGNFSKYDVKLLYILSNVRNYSILIYTVIGIFITSNIFYKNRIYEPIRILKREAEKIEHDDLSFSCFYKSNDEFQDVCSAFEKMRLRLIQNQKDTWNVLQQQRQLNSAFSHDLRTPLTVMEGYTEMLIKYYPKGRIDDKKLIEKLRLIEGEIIRLKRFSETMKGISSISSIVIDRKKQSLNIIAQKIRDRINAIMKKDNISINLIDKLTDEKLYFDLHIILEVFDNLISNAVRYAKSKIDIVLIQDKDKLNIYVKDDGKGLSKDDIYNGTRPYYSSNKESGEHYGLGLTICKMLCEKHGGNINLSNSIEGGAIICAIFSIYR